MKRKRDPNRYPKGWNAAQVRDVLRHYEGQSEQEAIAEDEAAFGPERTTVMEIPTAIVPGVLSMIADFERSSKSPTKTKRGRRSA